MAAYDFIADSRNYTLDKKQKEFLKLKTFFGNEIVANTRELMNISDDYAICFVQGGASMQFAMVPMNLLGAGQSADFADTGPRC